MSLQFEKLNLTSLLFAPMWERFRERFPRVEEQPPLPPATERFDAPTAELQPRVQLLPPQFLPRFWLVTEAGNELIQIQADRFIYNWRKLADDDVYPRYVAIRQRLVDELGNFRDFVADNALGELVFNQCELTYIDQILPGEIWTSHAELGRVFTFWAEPPAGVPDVEAVSVAIQSRRETNDGSPIGRVYVNAQSAVRVTDNSPIFALTLVARGAPSSPDVADALAMLDVEHDWLLRTFTDVTTPEMQRVWGRQDG